MLINYYGRLADVTGCAEESVLLPAGISTAFEFRDWLERKHNLGSALSDPAIRIAVNDEIIASDRALSANDEIAFLPPVGGG